MARLAQPGDRIIVMAFAAMTPEEADQHHPTVVILNERNEIIERIKT
ncbi:MAG: aspartate 1-decarboxylase [Planctomycetaceae bacterium]